MPLTTPSETYAATPLDQPTARSANRLWLMTCLGAMDGTILMLAAAGHLRGFAAALTVGLTVISGVGAWIAARDAFGGHKTARDYRTLGVMAAVSIAATIAAAWLGATLGQAITLHIVPKAVGVVLLLIAVEVAGFKLPTLRGAPLPILAIAAAAVLEAGLSAYQEWGAWIL